MFDFIGPVIVDREALEVQAGILGVKEVLRRVEVWISAQSIWFTDPARAWIYEHKSRQEERA